MIYNSEYKYQDLQTKLFNEIEYKWKNNDNSLALNFPKIEENINKQMSLTCIAFLPTDIQEKIYQQVIYPLQSIDPHNQFYDKKSLHLTVKNVYSPKYPPAYDQKIIALCNDAFTEVFSDTKPIDFDLIGLFELPTSLAIRGLSNESLRTFIHRIDAALEKRGLKDDKKYASNDVFFGNISFCRYSHYPNEQFISEINKLKNTEIGKFSINNVSLVTMNYVCSPETVSVINTYSLR
jgi:2'-5' RNA ligase